MEFIMKAGSTTLPAPTSVSSSDELIWSSNTGRSSHGKMLGTVVAQKKTFDVEWGVLTEAQAKTIVESTSGSDFFSFSIHELGQTTTLSVYRGTIKKETLGYIGDGTFYYRSVSVSFIQQ